MKLAQISPNDPITALALEGLMKTCPILLDAEFYSKTGNSDNVKKASESSDTATFRALNAANNPTAGSRTYESTGKSIVSFDAKVDVILEDRNEDVAPELAYQTKLEAIERGYVLQEKFFEGDQGSEATEFDGMRNLVTAPNTISPAASIVLPLGNSDANRKKQQEAYEYFQQRARSIKGGATHVYMNGLHKIRWLSIAKELGYYRLSKDELGNELEMIGNIIVRDAGLKTNGTDILPNSEVVSGENTTSSSYFFVRWGERSDLTVLTSKGLVGRYAGQVGNQHINNINMDAALVLQNDRALVQSKAWALEITAP
ncbi:MAG: hypothetical protein RLN90_09570 [Balneolaceae bacterium]